MSDTALPVPAPTASLPARTTLAIVLAVAAGALGTALVSQFAFGHAPCELCLTQRLPYDALIPVAAAGVLVRPSGRAARAWIALCGLLFAVGAVLAGFHAGVELHWWEGPSACSSTVHAQTLEDLRAQLSRAATTRCDQITWSFLGLSMAAWNFLLSTIAAALLLRRAARPA